MQSIIKSNLKIFHEYLQERHSGSLDQVGDDQLPDILGKFYRITQNRW